MTWDGPTIGAVAAAFGVVLAAIVAGAVQLVRLGAEVRSLAAPPTAPRDAERVTMLTPAPAPQPSSPALTPAGGLAAVVRDEAIESLRAELERERAERRTEEARAQAFREQMIGEMSAFRTLIAERTRRGGAQPRGGDDRGSTT